MLIPVILSGGAGTRLWPVSREAHPKPFMHIGGDKSLFEQTYERALALSTHAPLIVTNREYYFLSRDVLVSQAVKPDYLLENAARKTAPAVLLAALWSQRFGDATLLVMPADHLIGDQPAFLEAARKAAALAEAGHIALFGIRPATAETGFGYIETGAAIGETAYVAERFVEKPDRVTAERYVASGNYLWNSGMFCFRADTMLKAFAEHAPALLSAAVDVWRQSETSGDRTDLAPAFAALDNVSIDYAVMEHATNIAVVPGDFGWSDIGSWSAVADALPADRDGNTLVGQSILIETRNTHIESRERLVAAIGLDNLLIVDTPDALLVADRTKAQQVREVVSQLKKIDSDAYKLHRTVVRPWGKYTVLDVGPSFKIKSIVVKPGQSLSLQMHRQRSEHWVVVSGIAEVTIDDTVGLVHPNQSTYIPIGAKHRLRNAQAIELVMIEVQCGDYLGEDDIVRFTDIYGRV
jgi:mannose-1-phosphate guanylyltransferase/mannose-6-phosphate isomerase